MLPLLFRLTFTSLWSQLLLYAIAAGVVGYIAFNGWRGALGPLDAKTGTRQPATSMDRFLRAAAFGGAGAALAWFGLKYALPPGAFPGAKGEGIPLHTYGVLLAGGFIAAVTVAGRLAQDEWRRVQLVDGSWVDVSGPKHRDLVMDMAFWALVGGIAGSRLLFVIVNWKDYAKDWTQAFSLGGGLVFYGGLIGASLACWLFARANGIDFLRLADVCIPTVSLGQALGRLGCFSAGCCWGDVAPASSSVAVHFPGAGLAQDLFGRLAGMNSLAYTSQTDPDPKKVRYVVEATGEIFHQAVPGAVRISEWAAQHGHTLGVYPTQLFESAGQAVLFVALMYARRFRRFHGHILSLWLMSYAVLRSTVELFRGDEERGTMHGLLRDLEQFLGLQALADVVPLEAWYNISTSQLISLCMFTFGAVLLYQKGLRREGEAAGLGPTASAA
ncbi:prolipoprotein diacylglyceryl transferase [Pyxidicoccus fallax]|uniref:Phosphatidylglycerol--prolipoprotein diacylglyceryl transferase n=1 Tax=Pyxidicoccus fallax TaxID=394095 RepID=A0A848LIS8_9BACT|nr:prolipoprotein diacylglyceryl transferase [Pyxidicoccus fallax]NMO17627.1 prolipoprotein diacylglyceryl transferase [Pyxidicoccus fallax]NPC84592.1 prolipoprotein diacylglyceryl transferase [Pyxidicoccus fallax]